MSDDRPVQGVLSRRLLVIWMGGLLTASLGSAIVVGFAGAPAHRRFDWNLAAVAGTAVGTILLAGFTGALAWAASREMQATLQLAELTRRDFASRDKPLVLATPTGMITNSAREVEDSNRFLSVTLFNAGQGPALGVQLEGTYAGRGAADVRPRVLPALLANERFDWGLFVDQLSPESDPLELNGFEIKGTCTDRAGTEHEVIVRFG